MPFSAVNERETAQKRMFLLNPVADSCALSRILFALMD
jgi:hypothetical protein